MIGGVTVSNYDLMILFPRKLTIKCKITLTTFIFFILNSPYAPENLTSIIILKVL